ncbi:MAG: DUF4142 domain-containing protein [Brevundimonas sp.]
MLKASFTTTAAALAAVLALGGCTSAGMAGGQPQMATASAPMEYVRMAGASDLYEIRSSALVLETTQDPALRRFARMMVDHHTHTTRQVTEAARTAGLTPPPPALDPRKAEMIARLQSATSAARDELYLSQQMTVHDQALALHSGYARSGEEPALRAAAAGAVPVIEQHIAELQRLDDAR